MADNVEKCEHGHEGRDILFQSMECRLCFERDALGIYCECKRCFKGTQEHYITDWITQCKPAWYICFVQAKIGPGITRENFQRASSLMYVWCDCGDPESPCDKLSRCKRRGCEMCAIYFCSENQPNHFRAPESCICLRQNN